MKLTTLSKIVGAGIISLSLATLPNLSASAQTGTTTSPGTNSTVDNTTTTNTDRTVENRDSMDWDWLGLLGLLGLAGLAGRKREEPARYREPDEVSRTGSSTRY